MKHRLQQIRQSDPETKRRWLIGLCSITVLIIAFAWVLYMRAFVFTKSDSNATEDVRIGLWPVFKNGLTITGSSVSKAFNDIVFEMPEFGRRTTTIQNPK